MADRPPTDPAPRGADAPRQRELTALYARVQNVVEKHIEPVADQEEVLVAVTMYVRAIESLRFPVPAEATSGAERQEVVAWNAMVDVLNEVAPGWADDWDGSTTIDAAVKAIRALRTPPAPLPREGATDEYRDLTGCAHARHEECPQCICSECGTRVVRMTHEASNGRLTLPVPIVRAALTPAAPTTTKETR